MKIQKLLRIAISFAITAASMSAVSSAEADQVMTATVFTHDVAGKPVPNIPVTVQSLSSSGVRLTVQKKTGQDGKAKVLSYANVEAIYFGAGYGLIDRRPVFKTSLSKPNQVLDFTLPTQITRTVKVLAASGLPISGLQVTERGRQTSDCWSSADWRLCTNVDWFTEDTSATTDENGAALIQTYDLPSPRRDSSLLVYYSPFEGVQLTVHIAENDYKTNEVTKVVLDDVPSIELDVSTNLQSSKPFTISGELSEAPVIAPSSLKASTFRATRDIFKKVQFLSRVFSKNKWGSWKLIGTANVSSSGKVQLNKVKLAKGRYQIKIIGQGFSLAGKTKTISVR